MCVSKRLTPAFAPCRTQRLVAARAQTPQDLPAGLQKIVGAFQMVPDPMARYKQLLFYAAKLEKLPSEDQLPENKVEGCVSQVWVKPELRDDGNVYWRADSDSQLTKGLAALLVMGLSGCKPEDILKVRSGAYVGYDMSFMVHVFCGCVSRFTLDGLHVGCCRLVRWVGGRASK